MYAFFLKRLVMQLTLGTLRNHDGNANERVTSKYKFVLLVLTADRLAQLVEYRTTITYTQGL